MNLRSKTQNFEIKRNSKIIYRKRKKRSSRIAIMLTLRGKIPKALFIARNKINLNDIKILQIPPKRAITGGLILEIFRLKRTIKINS